MLTMLQSDGLRHRLKCGCSQHFAACHVREALHSYSKFSWQLLVHRVLLGVQAVTIGIYKPSVTTCISQQHPVHQQFPLACTRPDASAQLVA